MSDVKLYTVTEVSRLHLQCVNCLSLRVSRIILIYVQPYLKSFAGIGESIHYDESTNILSFLDIHADTLHTVDLNLGPSSHKQIPNLPLRPHKIIDCFHDSSLWLCNAKCGFGLMDKATAKSKYIARFPPTPTVAGQIPNDGACDSRGRFWTGTICDPFNFTVAEGSLWRLDPDLSIHEVIKGGIFISNGISFSLDEKVMYFTDSGKRRIDAYDYDVETGEISNRRAFYKHRQSGLDGDVAVPDGHAMDSEGCIWAAIYGGSKVVRISPQGKVIAEVRLPTRNITDVSFVEDDIFIICAKDENKKYPKSMEMSGHLFRCHVGVKGHPLNKFKLAEGYSGKEVSKL